MSIKQLKKKLIFIFLFFWNLYVRFFLIFFKNDKLKIKKKLNILFIKPKDYLNLYTKINKNFYETIFSSIYRFGPVGIFTDFNGKFLISKSCYINNYKCTDYSRKKILNLQNKNASNLQNINFNNFDLVIVFENCVDSYYIAKYKKTLWAVMFEDHSKTSFKKGIFFKPNKYDLILNQTLGYTPYSFLQRNYWIDFSYTFGNSDFLKKCKVKIKKNIDIVVEVNQEEYVKNYLKKNKIFKTVILDESLSFLNYVKTLSRSNFFLSIDCKSPRWGNSLLEAALCQNLLIANKNHFWNSQIIIDELHVTKLNDALLLIKKIKSKKNLYISLLEKQNKVLDQLNFIRPINQILEYSSLTKRNLNINNKK